LAKALAVGNVNVSQLHASNAYHCFHSWVLEDLPEPVELLLALAQGRVVLGAAECV
jgi:hypothetical protein